MTDAKEANALRSQMAQGMPEEPHFNGAAYKVSEDYSGAIDYARALRAYAAGLATKVVDLERILKDIGDEWNEGCDEECDSWGHTFTCKAADISQAKRALRERAERAETDREAMRLAKIKQQHLVGELREKLAALRDKTIEKCIRQVLTHAFFGMSTPESIAAELRALKGKSWPPACPR